MDFLLNKEKINEFNQVTGVETVENFWKIHCSGDENNLNQFPFGNPKYWREMTISIVFRNIENIDF